MIWIQSPDWPPISSNPVVCTPRVTHLFPAGRSALSVKPCSQKKGQNPLFSSLLGLSDASQEAFVLLTLWASILLKRWITFNPLTLLIQSHKVRQRPERAKEQKEKVFTRYIRKRWKLFAKVIFYSFLTANTFWSTSWGNFFMSTKLQNVHWHVSVVSHKAAERLLLAGCSRVKVALVLWRFTVTQTKSVQHAGRVSWWAMSCMTLVDTNWFRLCECVSAANVFMTLLQTAAGLLFSLKPGFFFLQNDVRIVWHSKAWETNNNVVSVESFCKLNVESLRQL